MTARHHAVGFEIPNFKEEKRPAMAPNPPEVVEVVLAPFSGAPKLCFDEVQIGSTSKQTVNLRNPSDFTTRVVALLPKDMEEHGLTVNSMNFEIPPRDKVCLEITFQPTKVVSSHHTVKIVDHSTKRQKGQFQVTCVAVAPKKQGSKKRKVWDKQPFLPVFGADLPVSISAKPPAAWAQSKSTKLVGDTALNPPDDTTFTLSPATDPVNATYVCPQPAEAKGDSPNFDDSLELAQSAPPKKVANTSKTQRNLNFDFEDTEKENHISPKKRRVANVSISDIGFDSLTPDLPVSTRGALKAKENVKTMSFSNLNFSLSLTPKAKETLDDPVNPPQLQEGDGPADVLMKLEPITPRVPVKSAGTAGPLMTPVFKAPVIRRDTGILAGPTFVKSEPITPLLPVVRVESYSPGRSVARVEPLTPRQQVAKIEPLRCLSSSFLAKVEAVTPAASLSKPLLAFEMSPPHRNTVVVRKELFGRPQVTSTPMETINGKPRKSQRKHLSPKSLTSFKKKNVRVYMAPPTPTRPNSFKAAEPSTLFEDPAHALYKQPLYNLDIYGTTTISDPFARNAIHPLEFQDKQARELIKWVNSVLTLPEEYSEVDVGVDVVALWKKSNASDTLTLPASRETVCSKYHKNELHLYNLRKSAHAIFQSKDMTDTLYHVHAKIDTGYISVKDDIDLHSDQGVRCHLVQLLMHYNPLWLRIGLEAIYGRDIQVQPKRPSLDLIIFIKNNFLSDKYIIERNSYNNVQHYRMPKFKKEMNDYIVFKYLSLIFFLDVAKKRCIVPYDPCLFRKESPIKESEGMLNEFIKEFIKCVSHMKKTLASWGYTLTHKQTAMDEYDFAVHSHLDLRDGASLTRLMEVILRKKHLIQKLRLPAISRLQKIHNVKVAFAALEEEKVQLVDVEPRDVVDAHREKIMSLLWQILHKFLKPRLESSAVVIQLWWRKQSLKVEIMRRIRAKEERKKDDAATRIQALWKGYRLRKRFPEMKEKLLDEKKAYLNMLEEMAERAKSQRMVQSAMVIQQWVRATVLMRKNRAEYVAKRHAVVTVQRRYRATRLMKKERSEYETKRCAAVKIQEWYRSCALAKQQRAEFQKLLAERRENLAALKIQQWYRATLAMKKSRREYQVKRDAAEKIQRWFRASALMMKERTAFQAKRQAAIKIQQKYRATTLMKQVRKEFENKRVAATMVQNWYRASLLMRRYRAEFQAKKAAAVNIQQWYRASAMMKKERKEFEVKRGAAVKIQKWYRATSLMRKEKAVFQAKKTAAVNIQHWYRASVMMKKERKEFEVKRGAAVEIQKWYRSTSLMRKERAVFQAKKIAAVNIQQWYRASVQMRKDRKEFVTKRASAVELQMWFRSVLLMRKEKASFQTKKEAAVKIQRWYKATAQMKKERDEFKAKRATALKIQVWYRSILLMRKDQVEFKKRKAAAMKLQRWYKASALMKKQREEFQSKRAAATKLQSWYRSILFARKEKVEFLAKKAAAIKIQQWYKATAHMKKDRMEFQAKRAATMRIQVYYRSTLLMRKERAEFRAKKIAAIKIQQWYKATAHMRKERKMFETKRSAAIRIQTYYRSIMCIRKGRAEFLAKKKAAIKIQHWYRSTVQMRTERKEFQCKRSAALRIQNRYRATVLMKKDRKAFLAERVAATKIQRWFRATALMIKVRSEFQAKRRAVVTLQRKFRATVFMKKERSELIVKLSAVLKIQRWYRATAVMEKQRALFLAQRSAAKTIGEWYKSLVLKRKARAEYVAQRSAAIKIQQWYRATITMKKERREFEAKRDQLRAFASMEEGRDWAEKVGKLVQWWYAHSKTCPMEQTVEVLHDELVKHCKQKAARKILRWYRSAVLTKATRLEFIKMKLAAIRLQVWYKNVLCVRKEARLRALKSAAQNANDWQKLVELMRLEREEYARKRQSDAAVRSAVRQALAIQVDQALKDSRRKELATPLESEASPSSPEEPDRSAENAAALATQVAAAKLIQDWYRGIQQKRQVRQYYMLRRDAVIKIQRSYRAYRKRVAEALAGSNGEEVKPKQLSIGENYENAIAVILNGNSSFHHLFVSFKNIDFALTHSTGLCERMVQSENSYEIVRAIYHYLSAENRSDFYQTVFDVAMSVILEAISYEVTYDAVWKHTKKCGGLDIILQFMGKFLEKGEPLFCKAATILWAFTKTPQQIKEILLSTDCKQRLNYYAKKLASKSAGQRMGSQRNASKPVVLPSLKRHGGYNPAKPTKKCFSTRMEALVVLQKTFS